MAWAKLNPRNEPGWLAEGRDETEGGGETGAAVVVVAGTVPTAGVIDPALGAVGGRGAEPLAGAAPPAPEVPVRGGGGGGGGDATVGAADAPEAEPPAAPAAAPCPAPMAIAATVLAAVVSAVSTVIIVLPTSPRTIRLAMNGTRAIEMENKIAVIASRIIWLEPTKLFRTPLALSTALMLDRFTADMSTWIIA